MSSSEKDIEASYGIGNEFFSLWLDEKMNYTCALFHDETDFSESLEEAQLNKLKKISEFAKIGRDTETVLDIGCGWGANLDYQATVNRVPQVHGFTLSAEQYKKCCERDLPNTTASCDDFWKYEAPHEFDAVTSICMAEHLVTPDDARAGKAVDIYRDYFKRVHGWTKPGTYFGFQAITRAGVPRKREDLADMRHATYVMFPNALTPRVEDLVTAAQPYYEVVQMHSRRYHYKMTCWHWRDRLRRNESRIRQKWGARLFDDYDRYLSTCINAFENNWQSLHQFSLRRLTNHRDPVAKLISA